MMLTCSAFRCSVFDGSTISGTSGDPGADDPPASECIPDSVLYVTVDDEAFARVRRDLEHPTHLPLDAPGDVGPLGGGKLDLREVGLGDLVQQPRVATALRVRGEESVHVGDEDRAIGAEGARVAGVGPPSFRRWWLARMCPKEPAPWTTRSGWRTAASSAARRRIAGRRAVRSLSLSVTTLPPSFTRSIGSRDTMRRS